MWKFNPIFSEHFVLEQRSILLLLSLLVSLLFLIFLTRMASDHLEQAIAQTTTTDRTNRVILDSEQLISSLRQTETHLRGYLLTGDPVFRVRYVSCRDSLSGQLAIIDSLIDHPGQRQRMQTMRGIIGQSVAAMNNSMALKDSQTTWPGLADNVLQSKALMEATLAVNREFQQQQQQMLNRQNHLRQQNYLLSPNYLRLVGGVSVVLLLFSSLFLLTELQGRIRVQRQLEEKIQALNHSNAELEQYAYVASHDLQEPLRKIRAFADRLLLRHRARVPEDAVHLLEKIERAAERMQTLIQDLLMYSRTITPEGHLQPTNLNQVLSNVKSDLSVLLADRHVTITTNPLPVLMAHPSQVHQLFLNLLTNAIKFAKEAVCPIIQIHYAYLEETSHMPEELKSNTPYHYLKFTDNGIGFEQDYAQKIFDIFQKLHDRNAYEGTGIGLAICKRVVANHGGSIRAEGRAGQGAIFHIYLPDVQKTE